MKVWADLSAIARLAALCLAIGFVLGLFVACSAGDEPVTSANVTEHNRQAVR